MSFRKTTFPVGTIGYQIKCSRNFIEVVIRNDNLTEQETKKLTNERLLDYNLTKILMELEGSSREAIKLLEEELHAVIVLLHAFI